MKSIRVFGLLLGIALVWTACGSQVEAQTLGLYGSHGFGHPGWFGYYSDPYASGRIPTPPYFSIHPPVYYSGPVARSYGYSPYAYPGTFKTPEIVTPEMIENPHTDESLPEPVQETKNVKVVRHQVIHNPFVRPELRGDIKLPQIAAAQAEDR